MKRVLFACFLFTAIGTMSVHRSFAQVTHVSAATFTASVNQLDAYIGAGNMSAAQTTWDSLHHMMVSVLSYTKNSIRVASTPADKAAYTAIMNTQRNLYTTILPLKSDLAANRAILHSKLGEFDATIY